MHSYYSNTGCLTSIAVQDKINSSREEAVTLPTALLLNVLDDVENVVHPNKCMFATPVGLHMAVG